MPTVLITGAAGSVGRELVTRLSSRGVAVVAFDLPQCDFSPLRDLPLVAVHPGNITDSGEVAAAAQAADTIIHLAALLPPASERDRAVTFAVNVEGTGHVITAARRRRAHLVLASSVSTYGDTSREQPPVSSRHGQEPLDLYAESKIAAERAVRDGDVPFTILRIAGISVPLVLDPPAVWPFARDQRVEFVIRADVVAALANCVGNAAAENRVFNVAGGPTWQMRGWEYVESQYGLLDIPPEEARYSTSPGWFDWYDTAEAQAALRFQNTTYDQFLAQLQQAIEEEFA